MIEQIAYRKMPESVEVMPVIFSDKVVSRKTGEGLKNVESFILTAGTVVLAHAQMSIPNGAEYISIGEIKLQDDLDVVASGSKDMGRATPNNSEMMSFTPDSEKRRLTQKALTLAEMHSDFAAFEAFYLAIQREDARLAKELLWERAELRNAGITNLANVTKLELITEVN